MSPTELRDSLRQKPFEPFRLVMSDGQGYDIRHPDLLMIGAGTAVVGLVSDENSTFYERSVKIDLLHVTRLEPLEGASPPASNNGQN